MSIHYTLVLQCCIREIFTNKKHNKAETHEMTNLSSAAIAKPSLTSNTAVDGSPLTLTCGPTNSAVTKYEFYKDNHKLTTSDQKSNTFTIKNVKFSDAGAYSCTAYKESFPSSSDKKTIKGATFPFSFSVYVCVCGVVSEIFFSNFK